MTKTYDLEDRTLEFAKAVRKFVKELPKHTANYEGYLTSSSKRHSREGGR